MLKQALTIAAAAAIVALPAYPCTSLIVSKGASADGSTMITYAADSHNLFGELYNQPAADHAPGSMRQIHDWDTGKFLGEIPEVEHTFATIGNMNEHGVAIAESTWGGRPELAGTGVIDYGSLIYTTLTRARNAREAVKIMTDLVAENGYASSGESFSIADPNEAWIMELIGKGQKDKGAVWVARRVPDGYISGHANHPRIHTFPLNDPETLYSPDVISFAREQGYFDGKDKDFDFSLAYGELDFGALRGCDARVWSFFNKHADGMDAYLPWINEAADPIMPLWVKPSHPVSVDDMQWMMRDHFEGTPFDMTLDIGAGPYAVPYRWRPMEFVVDGEKYVNERAIATQQTGFSFVARLNDALPEGMKGLLWFGTDDANTCTYIPVYCSTARAPHELAVGNGDICTLSWTSNFWVNNYVANQAYNRYSQMIPDIRRVQGGLQEAMAADAADLEARAANMSHAEILDATQALADKWANKATTDYKALGDYLLVKFMDGNIKYEDENGFMRTETGHGRSPKYGGYDERYYRSIATSPDGERLRVKPIQER